MYIYRGIHEIHSKNIENRITIAKNCIKRHLNHVLAFPHLGNGGGWSGGSFARRWSGACCWISQGSVVSYLKGLADLSHGGSHRFASLVRTKVLIVKKSTANWNMGPWIMISKREVTVWPQTLSLLSLLSVSLSLSLLCLIALIPSSLCYAPFRMRG